jgi:hypothetical protein
VGKLERDGRTSTSTTKADFDRIADRCSEVVWAVDLPLLEQLAFVERCFRVRLAANRFGAAVLA